MGAGDDVGEFTPDGEILCAGCADPRWAKTSCGLPCYCDRCGEPARLPDSDTEACRLAALRDDLNQGVLPPGLDARLRRGNNGAACLVIDAPGGDGEERVLITSDGRQERVWRREAGEPIAGPRDPALLEAIGWLIGHHQVPFLGGGARNWRPGVSPELVRARSLRHLGRARALLSSPRKETRP